MWNVLITHCHRNWLYHRNNTCTCVIPPKCTECTSCKHMFTKWYHLHIIVEIVPVHGIPYLLQWYYMYTVLYILYMSVGSTVSIYCVVISSTDYIIVYDSGHSSVTNNKLCTCTCRRPFYYWPCTCTLYICYVHVHVDCFFHTCITHACTRTCTVHAQTQESTYMYLLLLNLQYAKVRILLCTMYNYTIMHDNNTNVQMIDVYGTLLLCVWYCYRKY